LIVSPTGASSRALRSAIERRRATAENSFSFDPKRRITVWTVTPAPAATADSVTWSYSCSPNSAAAASRIRTAVASVAAARAPTS
jgi:hypothetical protein